MSQCTATSPLLLPWAHFELKLKAQRMSAPLQDQLPLKAGLKVQILSLFEKFLHLPLYWFLELPQESNKVAPCC